MQCNIVCTPLGPVHERACDGICPSSAAYVLDAAACPYDPSSGQHVPALAYAADRTCEFATVADAVAWGKKGLVATARSAYPSIYHEPANHTPRRHLYPQVSTFWPPVRVPPPVFFTLP